MAEPARVTHRRGAGLARLRRLVATIDAGDEATIQDALLRLSRSRRVLAPLALVVGAFAMLFRGLQLLWVNWRLLLVEVLPAMWVWVAMLDLKAHVLRGKGFAPLELVEAALLVLAAALVTAASLYLNVVFAFAISKRPPTAIRPAFTAARRHLRVVASIGCLVGAAVGVSAFVVPKWGLGWFALALGISLGVMMLVFVAVPARLLGATKGGSRRDRLVATVLASVLSAVVCTPTYALGRFGLVLIGTHGLFVLGAVLLAVGFLLQSGAAGAVKAIKVSASLVSGHHPVGMPAAPVPGAKGPSPLRRRPPTARHLRDSPEARRVTMTTSTPQRELRSTQFTTDGVSRPPTAGEGWVIFAGIALVSAGIMRLFDALWAFHYHGVLPQNLQDALFGHSLNAYGWLWVGVAVILGLAGIGVFFRNQISRWVGVGAGVVGAVTAIWWMPYYPVWSLTYIALGILVVYALVAHGEHVVEA